MRRLLIAVGISVAIGCGLDVAGSLDPAVASSTDAGPEGSAMLPDLDLDLDASTDGAPDAADIDGAADAASLDAEAMRPDAGVTFVPSHILPVYSLTAANVMLSRDTVVDTTARTVQDSTRVAPVPLMNMKTSNGIAIWSVGAFTLQSGTRLTVKGSQPLVVVASSTVEIDGHIDASGSDTTPGPGGFAAASGTGKGLDGVKTGGNASGAGGGGNATIGGSGGTKMSVAGGLGGPAENASGVKLVGGSGGGNGGGFPTASCSDPTRGRGGVGGGAIQFSAVGGISITGTFDLGGGGGSGGCADNGSANDYRGGGGGGAAGMLVFESATSIQVNSFAEIVAAGGGGGEGGESNGNGVDGFAGPAVPASTAVGGVGSGGNGGNGGQASNGSAFAPFGGLGNESAGGGGGSAGRVFFGTRGAAPIIVAGSTIAALRFDFAF